MIQLNEQSYCYDMSNDGCKTMVPCGMCWHTTEIFQWLEQRLWWVKSMTKGSNFLMRPWCPCFVGWRSLKTTLRPFGKNRGAGDWCTIGLIMKPVARGLNKPLYESSNQWEKDIYAPKWMVYHRKSIYKWMIWGYPYFRQPQAPLWINQPMGIWDIYLKIQGRIQRLYRRDTPRSTAKAPKMSRKVLGGWSHYLDHSLKFRDHSHPGRFCLSPQKKLTQEMFLFIRNMILERGWLNSPSKKHAEEYGMSIYKWLKMCSANIFRCPIFHFFPSMTGGCYTQITCPAICPRDKSSPCTCCAAIRLKSMPT